MHKGYFIIFCLVGFGCVAEAKRGHLFVGYSNATRAFPSENYSHVTNQSSFMEEILGGFGLSTNLMPSLAIESSAFFPGIFRKNIQHNGTGVFMTSARTGAADLMIKIKLLALTEHSIFYVKGGGWILHCLKKSCFINRPEKTLRTSELFGYGWAVGCGISSTTFPFCSLPLNFSLTYFHPRILHPGFLQHLPTCFQKNDVSSGFISIKLGLMWPN